MSKTIEQQVEEIADKVVAQVIDHGCDQTFAMLDLKSRLMNEMKYFSEERDRIAREEERKEAYQRVCEVVHGYADDARLEEFGDDLTDAILTTPEED